MQIQTVSKLETVISVVSIGRWGMGDQRFL